MAQISGPRGKLLAGYEVVALLSRWGLSSGGAVGSPDEVHAISAKANIRNSYLLEHAPQLDVRLSLTDGTMIVFEGVRAKRCCGSKLSIQAQGPEEIRNDPDQAAAQPIRNSKVGQVPPVRRKFRGPPLRMG